MVMYPSPFIPGLSTLTASLCELLMKEGDFTWNVMYKSAFNMSRVQLLITQHGYFHMTHPVSALEDTSQVDLRATLLQDSIPAVFTS